MYSKYVCVCIYKIYTIYSSAESSGPGIIPKTIIHIHTHTHVYIIIIIMFPKTNLYGRRSYHRRARVYIITDARVGLRVRFKVCFN